MSSSPQEIFPLVERLPPQNQHDVGKLALVLDMDETLVHVEYLGEIGKVPLSNNTDSNEDVVGIEPNTFHFTMDGRVFLVRKRPFLHEFLTLCAPHVELIVFTSAKEDYATHVLNGLDPNQQLFRHRLYRQHCHTGGAKDLIVVNRPLTRTVLVDNTFENFVPSQYDNCIPITTFHKNDKDRALYQLCKLVITLNRKPDVRPYLIENFKVRECLPRYLESKRKSQAARSRHYTLV